MLHMTGMHGMTTCACYRTLESTEVSSEIVVVSLETVRARVAMMLGSDPSALDIHTGLGEYGLDSLSAVELSGWVNRHGLKPVNTAFINSTRTLQQIVDRMLEQ